MKALRRVLTGRPVATRYAVVGSVVLGLSGSIAGLVLGLLAYAPTAWFAIVELGLPAALLGALLGLAVGLVASAFQWTRDPAPYLPR